MEGLLEEAVGTSLAVVTAGKEMKGKGTGDLLSEVGA